MRYIIREMKDSDRGAVLEMMRVFYASEAVATNGSEEIFKNDVDACVGDSPYLEGYVFESDGDIIGYGMAAKSFSTEYGKRCIWIEDAYVKEKYRGCGIGSGFLNYLSEKYSDSLLRLEVEADNKKAIAVYEKCGFDFMPYLEMKK